MEADAAARPRGERYDAALEVALQVEAHVGAQRPNLGEEAQEGGAAARPIEDHGARESAMAAEQRLRGRLHGPENLAARQSALESAEQRQGSGNVTDRSVENDEQSLRL